MEISRRDKSELFFLWKSRGREKKDYFIQTLISWKKNQKLCVSLSLFLLQNDPWETINFLNLAAAQKIITPGTLFCAKKSAATKQESEKILVRLV